MNKPQNQNEILLSVCVITYNQENYITQTLDSILTQKTSFPIEVIIGEDCSTDNTKKKCIDYVRRYPDIIKFFTSDKNTGMMPNFVTTLKACSGKYVAICEGDDFWTDSYKLQKQVELMEENPEVSICCHNSFILNDNNVNEVSLFNPLIIKTRYSMEEYLISSQWFVPTASIVFRNNMMECPDWLLNVKNGDVAVQLLLLRKGSLAYINDTMSVYRKLKTGVSFVNMKTLQQTHIQLLDTFNEFSGYKYNKEIEIRKARISNGIKKEKRITLIKIINKLLSYKGMEIRKKLPAK